MRDVVCRCAYLLSCALLILSFTTQAKSDMAQDILNRTDAMTFPSRPQEWRVELSKDWDVLGPFPIHAREQHFLSPSFPIDLSSPYQHEPRRRWPSSYADNGEVTWTTARADASGNLAVSFPHIRWETLRDTEGWAAFQHHSTLRTTLTIFPPEPGYSTISPKEVYVELKGGSYFTLIRHPEDDDERVSYSERLNPEWHPGNIYNLRCGERAGCPAAIDRQCNLSFDKPTVYDLFVSGDYEIRLFGVPEDKDNVVPTLRVSVSASLPLSSGLYRIESHDIAPYFVDGYAFGNALGVGLRAFEGSWKVNEVTWPESFPKCISLSLLSEIVIAPSQTRTVPIRLRQHGAYEGLHENYTLHFYLNVVSLDPERAGYSVLLPVQLGSRHLSMWTENWNDEEHIQASFFFATSHPTLFLAKPPNHPPDGDTSPILALHGAGVDVIMSPFWSDAIARQAKSWIIMPPGRTEWGLDWHGPSASEAWASVRALSEILDARYPSWSFDPNVKVTLIGHSNGGQGVWYLASRFPDRVRAVIPAAGYIKSQAYVPLTQSRAGHYIDPSLRAILESSLTPDDNDLFLTNVAKIPILVIHGGSDDNVPTWHSREYYSVVKSWGDGLNISFREDKGQLHWYPHVFDNEPVQQFLRQHLEKEESQNVTSFTLTVSDPAFSGSLHGWTIERVTTPGRLARLHVRIDEHVTHIRATNVQWASFTPHAAGSQNTLVINDEFQFEQVDIEGKRLLLLSEEGIWTRSELGVYDVALPPRGRIQNVLDTQAPFRLIIPDPVKYPKALSVAIRIAQVLDVYHKLDSEIITDETAFALFSTSKASDVDIPDSAPPSGNLIVIGGSENVFGKSLLAGKRTEFRLATEGVWGIKNRLFREAGVGLLFTHPHPTNRKGLTLFVAGTDDEGLERAWRLFPFRTGVAVPDWIVIGQDADWQGAGGVLGAGVWGDDWKWNEAMSWLS